MAPITAGTCWSDTPATGQAEPLHIPTLLSVESTSFLTHPHPSLLTDSTQTPNFRIHHPKPTHGPFGQPGGLLSLPATEFAVQYQRQGGGHSPHPTSSHPHHPIPSITIPPLPNTQPLPPEPHITCQLLLHLTQVSCAPPQAPPHLPAARGWAHQSPTPQGTLSNSFGVFSLQNLPDSMSNAGWPC